MSQIENISKAEAVKQQSRHLRGHIARDLPDTSVAVRQGRLFAAQISRRLPGLRSRQRDRAQAARRRQDLAVHGPGADSGRAAHGGAVSRPRPDRRELGRRLAADHHPAEHPVPRRRQIRIEGRDRRGRRRAADDPGGVRRCRAHGDDGAGADPRPGPRPARSRREAPVDPSAAADRRLSRDLGRRREMAGRRRQPPNPPTRSTASATCRANSRSGWRSPRTTRSMC